MTTDNVAMQLLRGSYNLDRMRAEVQQLVEMVIGLAFNCARRGASQIDIEEVFKSASCRWVVWGTMGSLDRTKNKVYVECLINKPCRPPHEKTHFITVGGYCSDKHYPFDTENVQQVHQNLNVLVEGIRRILPDFDRVMEPLLRAADAF